MLSGHHWFSVKHLTKTSPRTLEHRCTIITIPASRYLFLAFVDAYFWARLQWILRCLWFSCRRIPRLPIEMNNTASSSRRTLTSRLIRTWIAKAAKTLRVQEVSARTGMEEFRKGASLVQDGEGGGKFWKEAYRDEVMTETGTSLNIELSSATSLCL